MNKIRNRAVGAALSVVLPIYLLWIRAHQSEGLQLDYLGRVLYLTMPILLIVALTFLEWSLFRKPQAWFSWLKLNGLGIVLALALTVTCQIIDSPEMRVQFDESILLATSQTMYFSGTGKVATEAVPAENRLLVTQYKLDKRPPLYAYLVSVLHGIRGVSTNNAFLINALVLFLLLSTLFVAIQSELGFYPAIASLFFVLASPCVVLSATSGGFDLLSLFLLVLLVLSAIRFIRRPATHAFCGLMMIGLLFSYTRYESSLVFIGVLGICLIIARGHWKPDRLSWTLLFLLPLILTPLLFLSLHAAQPSFYPEAQGQPLFAWSYGLVHFLVFLGKFFDPRPSFPFAGSLDLLGGITFVIVTIKFGWKRREVGVISFVLVFTLGITLFHFYGDAGIPQAWRLFLPVALVGSLSPVLLQCIFPSRKTGMALVGVAICIFIVQFGPTNLAGDSLRTASGKIKERAIEELLTKLAPNQYSNLFVSELSSLVISQGYASVSPRTFMSNSAAFSRLQDKGEPIKIWLLEIPEEQADSADTRALMMNYPLKQMAERKGQIPMKMFQILGPKIN